VVADSGKQAVAWATAHAVHLAIIDLSTPIDRDAPGPGRIDGGGLWLLEVLARHPQRPPIVFINSHTYSVRRAQRIMNHALRLGAFTVLNRPVQMQHLLLSIQRVVDRNYRGRWPEADAERSEASGLPPNP
jgi:CheY-like chemotaxis protein